MGRNKLPVTQKKSGNLALRISADLDERLSATCDERGVTKTEVVARVLEQSFDDGTVGRIIETIEAERAEVRSRLTRDELVRRLRATNREASLLEAALASLAD